jgi:hypothetical protein
MVLAVKNIEMILSEASAVGADTGGANEEESS